MAALSLNDMDMILNNMEQDYNYTWAPRQLIFLYCAETSLVGVYSHISWHAFKQYCDKISGMKSQLYAHPSYQTWVGFVFRISISLQYGIIQQ